MRPTMRNWIKLVPALVIIVACVPARAEPVKAANTAPPANFVAHEAPPPPSIAEWSASLPPVTVEGQRIARPNLHQVFDRNLLHDDSIEFTSTDLGDGRRCTSVQPFGYGVCTAAATKFVVRVE